MMPINFNFDSSGRPPQSLAARIVGGVCAVIAFGVALMFSAVVFVGLVLAALAFWGYFWWKTRALRRAMQEQMRAQGFDPPPGEPPRNAPADADVIEGEAVRVEEERKRIE
jgi:hypothetical protein